MQSKLKLNSYADVQQLLNDFLSKNAVTPPGQPHGTFWNSMTYEEFTTGTVPGVTPAYQILVPGDSANSNIIMALSGIPGTVFDPNTGTIGQMPQPSPPYNVAIPLQTQVICALADWIDRCCPNPNPLPDCPKAGSSKD